MVKIDKCTASFKNASYLVGLIVVITIFAIALYAIVPGILHINNSEDFEKTDDEVMKIFQNDPAYVAIYERFPNAVEELENDSRGASLQIGVADFEKGDNMINLELILNRYNGFVERHVFVVLMTLKNSFHPASGPLAIEFIKTTNCLN